MSNIASLLFAKKFGGGSLSKEQINALDALFNAASYVKDVSAEYAAFCDAFCLSEPDDPTEFAFLIHRYTSKLNDTTMSIANEENAKRLILYSATLNERVYAENNGSYWGNSTYSPLRIPVGAVSARVDVPSGMRYGAFIAKPHDTDEKRVMVVVDSGWITDGRSVDVSSYNDGTYYFSANIAYTSNADIPADFDTSVIDFYFADANGNRMP